MGRVSRASFACLALVGASACTPPKSAKGENHPLLRKTAPDDDVTMQAGGDWHPANANGKVLVLDFWATWCDPCRQSFPELETISKKFPGVKVVAVSEDTDAKKIPKFVQETGVSFDIGVDQDGRMAEKYGVDSMPTSFVIDKRGVVRFVHAGYHADDAQKLDDEVSQLTKE